MLMACGTVNEWFASTMISMSSPTALRTASTREMSLRWLPRPIFILMARNPCSWYPSALGHRLRVELFEILEVETRRVRTHLVAEGAADQLVHGLVERLADDVPERDVHAADGRDRHAREAVVLDLVVEQLPDGLDIERVEADQRGLVERLDHAARDGGGPVAIAPSDDAGIGHDLDHAGALRLVVLAARGGEGLVDLYHELVRNDIGDLQGGSFQYAGPLAHGEKGAGTRILFSCVRSNGTTFAE